MTTEGYSAIREPPAELDDSKVMIKRLAQFHAASVYLVENVSCDAILGKSAITMTKLVENVTFWPSGMSATSQ